MFKFVKDDNLITYNISGKAIIAELKKNNDRHIFALIPPGNVFLLSDNQWKLLDTLSLPSDREYKDFLDKASHDLVTVLTRFPIGDSKLHLNEEQIFFMDAVGYDLVQKGSLNWLPENAHEFKFTDDGQLIITYDDGTTETKNMPSKKGIHIESSFPSLPEDELSVDLIPDSQMPSPRGKSPELPLVSSPLMERETYYATTEEYISENEEKSLPSIVEDIDSSSEDEDSSSEDVLNLPTIDN